MPQILFSEVVSGEAVSGDVVADALNQMTSALETGFTSMQTAFVGGAVIVVGIGIGIFAVKWAPKMLMKLFKAITNQ